eukprot:gene13911-15353_t
MSRFASLSCDVSDDENKQLPDVTGENHTSTTPPIVGDGKYLVDEVGWQHPKSRSQQGSSRKIPKSHGSAENALGGTQNQALRNKPAFQGKFSHGNSKNGRLVTMIAALVTASQKRLASPPLETKGNWNRRLRELKACSFELIESNELQVQLLDQVFQALGKIFFLQPKAFVYVKYAAISICEAALMKCVSQNFNSSDRLRLLYHMANFNCHAKHDVWRSSKPGDQNFFGLARFLERYHRSSLDSQPTFNNGVEFVLADNSSVKLSCTDGKDLERLRQTFKLCVLTGHNGSRKTQILDFIFDKVLQHNFEEEAKFLFALYVESEATVLRKVRGVKTFDFKFEYVHEKILGYFGDNDEREDVSFTLKENINSKIAVALFDQFLVGNIKREDLYTEKKWAELSESDQNNFKREVIKTSERLLFSENSLQEPITIAENICKQHMEFVCEKFRTDLFSLEFFDGLIEKVSLFLKDRVLPKSEHKLKDVLQFHHKYDSFWTPDKDAFFESYLKNYASVIERFTCYIAFNRQNYYTVCTGYCKEVHNIQSPNLVLSRMFQSYLPSYDAQFEWDSYYSSDFYIKRFTNQPPPKDSFNTLCIYDKTEDSSSSYCVTSFYRAGETEPTYEEIKLPFKANVDVSSEQESRKIYDAVSNSGRITTGKFRFIVRKHCEPIEIYNLSSGELIALKLILWGYVSKGLNFSDRKHETFESRASSKIQFLLLDEVDKHFDSNLSRSLMKIIVDEFIKSDVVVMMTTHKPDTLALVPVGGEYQIFTVETLSPCSTLVVETHRLLALHRLTRNMYQITTHHHVVYTESRKDATFYQSVYDILMEFCDDLRLRKTVAEWQKQSPEYSYLLSHRCRMLFTSVSSKGDGEGNCGKVVESIARDITSFKNNPRVNGFYNSSILYSPYGILDHDYKEDFTSDFEKVDCAERLADSSGVPNYRERKRIFILSRYSLENYLFDPFVLCGVKDCLKLDDFADFSYRKDGTKYFDKVSDKLMGILNDLSTCLQNPSFSREEIQKILDEYFAFLFQKLSLRPNVLTAECARAKISRLFERFKDVEGLLPNQRVQILIDGRTVLDVMYPEEFLRFRGHKLVQVILTGNSKDREAKLSEKIINKIQMDRLQYIPMDLMQTLFDINKSIVEHVREVLKVGKVKSPWISKIENMLMKKEDAYSRKAEVAEKERLYKLSLIRAAIVKTPETPKSNISSGGKQPNDQTIRSKAFGSSKNTKGKATGETAARPESVKSSRPTKTASSSGRTPSKKK